MKLQYRRYTPTLKEIKNSSEWVANGSDEDAELAVYCYNRKTFTQGFSNPEVWDRITMNTRGCVFDRDGNMIARGFPKVFNYGERQDNPITGEHLLLVEKFCGHMAIVFWHEHESRWRICTKQGIAHEFEDMDQDMLLSKQFYGWDGPMDKTKVYICEGIDSLRDPHTIRYKNPGLYLLWTYSLTDDTFEFDTEAYPGEVQPVGDMDEAGLMQRTAPHEGYIVIAHTEGIVKECYKLKSPTYLKLRATLKDTKAALKNMDSVYQNFTVDAGGYSFDREAVVDLLGDWADDHMPNIELVVEKLSHRLHNFLREADETAFELRRNRRAVLETCDDVQFHKVTWAIIDRKWDIITEVVNRRLVPRWYKEITEE